MCTALNFFLRASILLCLIAASGLHLQARQGYIDSLFAAVKSAPEDSFKVYRLNNLSDALWRSGSYPKADSVARVALQLSEKINFKKGKGDAYNNMGLIRWNQGNYQEALSSFRASLKISEELNNKRGIAACYGNIGLIYYEQGNYPEALKNQFADLEIAEQTGDKHLLANAYTNIGNIYTELGNYDEALKNQRANLKLAEELRDKKLIANAYTNIGNNYYYQQNYPEALRNYLAALKINEEIGNKKGIAIAHNNMGEVYSLQGNEAEAMKNYQEAMRTRKEIGDKKGMSSCYISLGNLYMNLRNFAEAKKYLEDALALSKEIGSKEKIKNSYEKLARLDSLQGDYRAAYDHYIRYVAYRDSLVNESNIKKTVQAQMQYEFDKKDAISRLEQEKEKQQQSIILWSVTGGLLLVLVFSAFLVNRFRIIHRQKLVIEEKNTYITDSINYAKRIQDARLPKKEDIHAFLRHSFILFKPKDIVSGDFYFFHKTDDVVILAAADCTGHGVPGAFMSMICSEKLSEAVNQTTDLSGILELLNRGIKASLRQSEIAASSRDGMDIAICSVNTASGIIHYAGANRPCWLIRQGEAEIEEIKATKKAIGGFTEDTQHFETHRLRMSAGDTFYIFSDGYADTFGGDHRKKLTTKKFRELLIEISEKSMPEQEKYLDRFIEEWKSGTEQIDDILVIGVRLS